MLAVRWTIGDVAPRGFAALRASVWGAWWLFGPAARYRIYVNTVAIDDARAGGGELPAPSSELDEQGLQIAALLAAAEEVRAEHWDALAGEVARRVGL